MSMAMASPRLEQVGVVEEGEAGWAGSEVRLPRAQDSVAPFSLFLLCSNFCFNLFSQHLIFIKWDTSPNISVTLYNTATKVWLQNKIIWILFIYFKGLNGAVWYCFYLFKLVKHFNKYWLQSHHGQMIIRKF